MPPGTYRPARERPDHLRERRADASSRFAGTSASRSRRWKSDPLRGELERTAALRRRGVEGRAERASFPRTSPSAPHPSVEPAGVLEERGVPSRANVCTMTCAASRTGASSSSEIRARRRAPTLRRATGHGCRASARRSLREPVLPFTRPDVGEPTTPPARSGGRAASPSRPCGTSRARLLHTLRVNPARGCCIPHPCVTHGPVAPEPHRRARRRPLRGLARHERIPGARRGRARGGGAAATPTSGGGSWRGVAIAGSPELPGPRLVWLARRLGSAAVVPMVLETEAGDADKYDQQGEEAREIADEERAHARRSSG